MTQRSPPPRRRRNSDHCRPLHDSGKTTRVNGKKEPVLIPMLPFGFRFEHEGRYYGMSHALAGMAGVKLTPLGSNWYKVRIPSEGSVKIQTTVTAEETPKQRHDGP